MSQPSPIIVSTTGTFSDKAGGTGTFDGTFAITKFVREQTGIVAWGTLTGTFVDSLGRSVTGTVSDGIAVPVYSSGAKDRCQPLCVEMGPFQLDCLGMQLNLSRVVLGLTEELA